MMPEPEACLIGRVYANEYDDLAALVRIVTHLENSGIVNGMPGFGSPLLRRRVPADPENSEPNDTVQIDQALHDAFYAGDDAAKALIAERVRATGRSCWSALVKFYGPQAMVRLQWEIAKERFSEIRGVRFGRAGALWLPALRCRSREGAQADLRHSEPECLQFRHPHGASARTDGGTPGVLAGDSAHRRGDLRSPARSSRGFSGKRGCRSALQSSRLRVGSRADDDRDLSHRARRRDQREISQSRHGA